MGLLLLPVCETEVEYVSLHQIVLICLASILVDWHQAASLLVVLAMLAQMQWIRLCQPTCICHTANIFG